MSTSSLSLEGSEYHHQFLAPPAVLASSGSNKPDVSERVDDLASQIHLGPVFFNALEEFDNDQAILERVEDLGLQNRDDYRDDQSKIRRLATRRNSLVISKSFDSQELYKTEFDMLIKGKGTPHLENIRAVRETDEEFEIILDDIGDSNLFGYVSKQELSEEDTLRLARQVLECMKELHSRGIIHRNLNLKNLCVAATPSGLQFTVTDLSKAVENSDDPEICQLGSNASPSPEDILSNKSCPDQDIWSLGYLIFFAISKEFLLFRFADPENRSNFDDTGCLLHLISSALSGRFLVPRTPRQKDWYLELLHEMQIVFGEFPQSMIEAAPQDLREKYFKKQRSWKNPCEFKYVLKELKKEFENVGSLEERIANFPESIKVLLRRIFTYENRPTAEELLNLIYLWQEDQGAHLV